MAFTLTDTCQLSTNLVETVLPYHPSEQHG